MTGSPLRVLVVEDSSVAGEMIVRTLQADSEIETVGIARDGAEAIELVQRLRPDLVTMDINMPRLDGYSAVEHIMAYNPTPILVLTGTRLSSDVDISLRLLAAGALDVMEKPVYLDEAGWQAQQRELLAKVKLLAHVPVVTHLKGRRSFAADGRPRPAPAAGFDPNLRPGSVAPPTRSRGKTGGLRSPARLRAPRLTEPTFPADPRYQVVAIAASTGGPQALVTILRQLPLNLPVPVLIVQHIASGFTVGLAEWLAHESGLTVQLAKHGTAAHPGQVLLAPDDRHLLVNKLDDACHLTTQDGPGEELRPAADFLFQTIAASYGARAIGAILTGMGRDGASGLLAMQRAGAATIAQDEASAVIFGMPAAAIELGAAREVLSLERIGPRIVELLQLPAEAS